MNKKHAVWLSWLGGLALMTAGCSGGGGSGGSSFFVQTCNLGCNSGAGGTQISCGVVNTFENQDLALLFSQPVDLGSVNKQSFQIFSLTGAAVPAGSFLVDPLNDRRLIFRPKLSFNGIGEPIFGFLENQSYEIRLNGTVQKDPPPFVKSTGGVDNASRLLCTVTADQGIVDPTPGQPTVALFAEQLTGGGGTTSVQLGGTPPFPTNFSSTSKITFVFDELMDIGTIVIPSTGLAPFILVEFDGDGLLQTKNDRSVRDGTFVYSVDQTTLKTTVVFTPSLPYPSGGSNPAQPLLIVVTVPSQVTDVAGVSVGNPGEFAFAPEVVQFSPITLTEDFTSTAGEDVSRTGAVWNTALGRLEPGIGGGSGAIGDLVVPAGQVVTLHTSPTPAEGTVSFANLPIDGDVISLNGEAFTWRDVPSLPTDLTIQDADLPWTVSTLVDELNAFVAANGGSPAAAATYSQTAASEMLVRAATAGTAGNQFSLSLQASPTGAGQLPASAPASLSGGSSGDVFPGKSVISNFDFQSSPGGLPSDVTVADGVYEFASIDIQPGGTLRFVGDNPARLLARGSFDLKTTGVLDVSGESNPAHLGLSPYGQPGGRGGPAAGNGGRGGDRAQSPVDLQSSGGVTLASATLDGSDAEGVGGDPIRGPGRGGEHWPPTYPSAVDAFEDLAVDSLSCTSAQLGAGGSGGGYGTDGGRSQTTSSSPSGINSMNETACNVPNILTVSPGFVCPPRFFVPGGGNVGLEPPSANPTAERLLKPAEGNLLGGAGGGGAGGGLFGTQSSPFPPCFGLVISSYRDNSGAGGGGGGGAVQIQAGREARITGQIDASGGEGGTDDITDAGSSSGGGGAGGALLVQTNALVLAPLADRILVDGGSGGLDSPGLQTFGGKGGKGLVRVETNNGVTADEVASAINPIDPMDPTSVKWLSVGGWSFLPDPMKTTPEEGLSGGQSCWLVPTVPGYFSLDFKDDPVGPAAPADYGWNMDVIIDFGLGPQAVPYRGSDGNGPVAFGGMYPEEFWGTDLGSAPIVVRFQGALTGGPLSDPCTASPLDASSGIAFDSDTPWVNDPDELDFFALPVSIVRFQVVFDAFNPSPAGSVLGVTNLRIEATPE